MAIDDERKRMIASGMPGGSVKVTNPGRDMNKSRGKFLVPGSGYAGTAAAGRGVPRTVQRSSGPIRPNYNRGRKEPTYLSQAIDIIKGMPTGPGDFKGSAGKARSQTRRIKQARMLSTLFSDAGLENMKQRGQTDRVRLTGQNQLANTALSGQNQLANTALSGQNQRANTTLQGENQLANTALYGKNRLEEEKLSGALSQHQRGNLLQKLGQQYEQDKLTGLVPKDKDGNFMSLEERIKQNPRLYNLLGSLEQGSETESVTPPTAQELFDSTKIQPDREDEPKYFNDFYNSNYSETEKSGNPYDAPGYGIPTQQEESNAPIGEFLKKGILRVKKAHQDAWK